MHPLIVRNLARVQAQMQEQSMQVYQLFDTRNKGYIDMADLSEGMRILGYDIDNKQIQQLIQMLDKRRSGVIRKQNFKKFMTLRMDFKSDADYLKQAFQLFDQKKKGKINIKDIARVAEEIGERAEQSQKILMEADKDQDGALNYDEFVRVIKKTSHF